MMIGEGGATAFGPHTEPVGSGSSLPHGRREDGAGPEARARVALVIVDAQEDTFAIAREPGRVTAVAALNRLLDWARRDRVPVALVRQETANPLVRMMSGGRFAPGTTGAALVAGLMESDEPVFVKHVNDAFEAPGFEEWLDATGARTLVIAGGLAEACVKATVISARARQLDVILVEEALLSTSGPVLRKALNAMQRAGARVARSAEVVAG